MGHNNGDNTVEPRDADAHGDQREHVRRVVHDGGPSPLKERGTAPKHHRRGQQQLHPGQHLSSEPMVERHAGNHVGHGDEHHQHRRSHADPESTTHVLQFRIADILSRDYFGLKRHPTNPAGTRLRL